MPGGAHILRNGAEVKEGKGRAPSRQSSELHEPIQPGAALVAAAGLPAEPSRRDAGLPVPPAAAQMKQQDQVAWGYGGQHDYMLQQQQNYYMGGKPQMRPNP